MAAIVYHGLQSHLETQIVESRTLRLRLPSPKPIPSQSIDLAFKSCFWDSNSNTKTNQEENKTITYQQNNNNNTSGCGWSFLDALSNISQDTKPSQKENSYVHPHQKRSSLVLSPKSLELCTENLGNESGTDILENGIEMLSSTSNNGGWNFETREQRQEPSQHVATKKAKTQSFNFPPPLTTIRGSESLRVRPHREDGRLVIEVTKVPPISSCFQVERSHGRLRLCFLTNDTTSFDPQEEEEEVEEDVPYENEPICNDEFDEEFSENEINAQVQYFEEDDDEKEEDEEEETEEEAEEKEEGVECGEMMRMEKEAKRRRCKEGSENENNELLKWGEPFWVATS